MAKRKVKTETQSSEQTPIQLNLATLSDYKKDIDELETIILADGKFRFTINKTFKRTIIDEKLIPDIQAAFLTLKKDNIDMDDVSDSLRIVIMCILKQFTNLGLNHLNMTKEPDVRKLVAVAKELYDKEVFKEIIQGISKTEMEKVFEQLKLLNVVQGQINEMFTSISLAEMEKSDNSGNNLVGTISEGTTEEN